MNEFLDAERFEHSNQCLELVGRSGRFDRHRVRRDVDDLGAEQLHGSEHVRPCLEVGLDAELEALETGAYRVAPSGVGVEDQDVVPGTSDAEEGVNLALRLQQE